MSEKTKFENEKVLEKAIDVTTQHTARFFDIVSDHELVYSNLEGHVLAIYGVDDSTSPVALTPYFDGLTTYNIKDYFEVPTIKTYYIVDITEYTGRDLLSSNDYLEVESDKKVDIEIEKIPIDDDFEIVKKVNKHNSDYSVAVFEKLTESQNVCEYTLIEEAMEEVGFYEEEDKVNQPSHYTFSDKFEIIDVVEEITSQYPPYLAFAVGNAIKYIARSQHKNGKQDIEKSIWYLQRVLEKYDEE